MVSLCYHLLSHSLRFMSLLSFISTMESSLNLRFKSSPSSCSMLSLSSCDRYISEMGLLCYVSFFFVVVIES